MSGVENPLVHRTAARVGMVTMVAAGTSQFVHHPLYTLKTHMQSQNHIGMVQFCRNLFRTTDPLKFLYKGVCPRVFGCMPEKMFKMQAWALAMHFIGESTEGENFSRCLASWLLAGSAAGVATTLIGCPAELLMVQAQTRNCNVVEFARQQGLRRMYTGASATVFRDISFNAVFFTLRQSALRVYEQQTGSPAGWWTTFIFGATAGCTAATLACPLDVVKTRLQETNFKGGKIPWYRLLVQIARQEGAGALFYGLGPRLVAVPSMMSFFTLLQDQFELRLFGNTTLSR